MKMKSEYWESEDADYWKEKHKFMIKNYTFIFVLYAAVFAFTNQNFLFAITLLPLTSGLLARQTYKHWATKKGIWK